MGFLCGLLLVAGCRPGSPVPPVSATTNQTYPVRGVVREIPPDHRHVTIQHEDIPGYMGAMTMGFSVKDTNALNGISVGDIISFALVVAGDDDWVENLRRVGANSSASPGQGWQKVGLELNVGDTLPDYEFTGENGRPVRFSDFRGRAVAFTFFFTSCPLPEYCPRMNKNFAGARDLLLHDPYPPDNWQMLSISFDSSFDTPPVLSSYANFYRGGDTNRWQFAVASTNTLASLAPKLGLNFWRENGSISHNLRTVVLDRSGKIYRQFDGNGWTAEELAAAIRVAAVALPP